MIITLALALAAQDAVEGVDLGLDPSMAAGAGVGVILSKAVVYPLVLQRRRKPDDVDDNTGPFYIPRQAQSLVAFVIVAVVSAVGALLLGEPVVPTISAGIVGLSLARVTHEAGAR